MAGMRERSRRALVACVVALAAATLAACTSGTPASTVTPTSSAAGPGATVAAGTTGSVDLDGRPYRLHVPSGHDPARPAALVVGLHGYSSTSDELDRFLGLTAASDERGFLLALPEGTVDSRGNQFWDAAPSCCDFDRTGVDDSGYLSRLVTQVEQQYAVDRVVVLGHSNGGYMSHRFACDHADQVDAIASLAGPLPADTSSCAPSRAVTVLHVHGTGDATVPYGGRTGDSSAEQTVAAWAALDGCATAPDTSAPSLDLVSTTAGADTTVTAYTGCRDRTGVELWTIRDAPHVPSLTAAFTPALLDFLLPQA